MIDRSLMILSLLVFRDTGNRQRWEEIGGEVGNWVMICGQCPWQTRFCCSLHRHNSSTWWKAWTGSRNWQKYIYINTVYWPEWLLSTTAQHTCGRSGLPNALCNIKTYIYTVSLNIQHRAAPLKKQVFCHKSNPKNNVCESCRWFSLCHSHKNHR